MMRVPQFKDPEMTKFVTELLREIDRSDKDNLSSVTANHSVLLISPSKKVFEVTVTDAGALVVTAASVTAASRNLPR
jgi:hypothetical protein